MSINLAAVPNAEGPDEVTLPITFPKERETYNLNGKNLYTEMALGPGVRVRGQFEGFASSMAVHFGDGTAKWVIQVDFCELEPSE